MTRVPGEALNVELPAGFYLEEEGDFVHLLFGKEKVATFTESANPHEIRKEAEDYLRKKEKQ